MTGERLAVIDLGSNTFHLLICETGKDHTWSVIHKERTYVKLGSGGLDFIDSAAIARGLEAMTRFCDQITSYGVRHIRCIGTAALREARNGRDVAQYFRSQTGLPVDIIDGQKEASYILRGIQTCIPTLELPGLIMDIGGGSVEFILYQGDDIRFKGSYKIGVAVLYKLFHHHDPITLGELAQLEAFLETQLAELTEVLRDTGPYFLIGASGSFEVVNDVLLKTDAGPHWSRLDTDGLLPYLDEIIATDIHSRRQLPEIPVERLDYIVVAYALIRFIMTRAAPHGLYFCEYALKEGVLSEMIAEINLDRSKFIF